MLFHIGDKQRLDILKPSFADVIFELADTSWLICSASFAGKRGDSLPGEDIARIQFKSSSIGRRSALRVTPLFKNCSQKMFGIGGFGLQFERVPKLGCGLPQIPLFERNMAFRDIQSRVLPSIVRGSQFSAFLQLNSTLVLVSCPNQSQPQLIMSLGILWL